MSLFSLQNLTSLCLLFVNNWARIKFPASVCSQIDKVKKAKCLSSWKLPPESCLQWQTEADKMRSPPGDESDSEVFKVCGQQGEDSKMIYHRLWLQTFFQFLLFLLLPFDIFLLCFSICMYSFFFHLPFKEQQFNWSVWTNNWVLFYSCLSLGKDSIWSVWNSQNNNFLHRNSCS